MINNACKKHTPSLDQLCHRVAELTTRALSPAPESVDHHCRTVCYQYWGKAASIQFHLEMIILP